MKVRAQNCAECGTAIHVDGRAWKYPLLPWIFCSQKCVADYMGKDESGQEPSADKETK